MNPVCRITNKLWFGDRKIEIPVDFMYRQEVKFADGSLKIMMISFMIWAYIAQIFFV